MGYQPGLSVEMGLGRGGKSKPLELSPGIPAHLPAALQKDKYVSVVREMENLGARVVFPLEDVPDPDDLKYEGEALHSIACL